MSEKTIEERAAALGQDPTIHDPEALRYLIECAALVTKDLRGELAMRDALIQSCIKLADTHAGQCGVTDTIAQLLRACPSTVPAANVEIINPELINPDNAHLIKGQTAKTADGKWMARAVVMGTGQVIAEVGPEPTREAAQQALHEAIIASGAVEVDINDQLDAAIAAAMGRQSGAVH